MDGATRTPVHVGEHRRPDPPGKPLGRVVAAVSAGVLLLAVVGAGSIPAWSWHPVGQAVTGPVGSPLPDPFTLPPAIPAQVVPPVLDAPPVEVPPPVVRIHRGTLTQDCTLTDPAVPLYDCRGGK